MNETLYNSEERINRYLRGEMTPEEEALFEVDLQKDEILRKQAEAAARMIKGMEFVGKEHDKSLVKKMKASSQNRIKPVWWMSIAASIAIIVTVGYHIYDYSATTRLGREYATVFPMSDIIRGEEDENVSATLTILFDNVANGKDLDNTIKQLEILWQKSQSDTYNEYTTYAPYIGWNLAIAHLRNYDKKEAKKVLDDLQENCSVGTFLGNKIFELKEKL